MDFEVVPEHDKVGTGAQANSPEVLPPEQGGRTLARGGEDFAERHAEAGEMANAVEQLGRRAGDHPVLASHHSMLRDDRHLAQDKLAVTKARGGRSVADKVPAPACSAEHDSEHVVGDVDTVGDDLNRHPRVRMKSFTW